MLRAVGLHPAEDFDSHSTAALADVLLAESQRLLDELVDAHLVEEPRPGRYRLHDLVRTFASGLAAATDPEPRCREAVGRLLDYFLHATLAASAGLDSQTSRSVLQRDLRLGEPARPDLLATPGARGTSWLEAERPSLTAAIRSAAATGHPLRAWQLARAMWRFLYRRGYLEAIIDTHRLGLAAAEATGDTDAVAAMRNYLAYACTQTGRHEDAVAHLRATLAQRTATGNRGGEASARQNLMITYAVAGRFHEAAEECERALAIARRSGDLTTLASAVVNVGYVYLTLGRLGEAIRHSRHGLLLAREIGDDGLAAITIGNIGAIRARMGDHRAATRLLRAGWKASQRTSNIPTQAEALNELGMIDRALGDYDSAVEHHRQALILVREAGFRGGECVVYTELGRTLHAAGDVASALELHRQALAGSTKIRYKYGEARALDGIGACLRDTDPAAARQHWLRALRLLQELGHPDQHEVARQLAALPGPALNRS
jgi:tetratricopeptide (TPR) repeat protein